MADRVTPAEMRGRAHSLRNAAQDAEERGLPVGDLEMLAFVGNLRVGADALDRLADVIGHAEKWENRPPSSPYALGLKDAWRTILRIALGESTSNEDRSKP
ncbi:hypothetical protein [Microbacterium excoecariae]|uniref:hypothetical protein n=1 Tax=Microbacterium excoecariae TaxID=2715210 RepID=UPI00140AE1AD|nr:hypothetical protein [Microbacterium excoecariae]NHI16845.1 hypothetical protein [Microbacterium excoecariae]